MRILLVSLTLLISLSSSAYELVVIQTVSNEQNSFITRQGSDDGIFVHKRSTFTNNNVSIICKAEEVTQHFTKWRVMNENAKVPFRKGDVITHYGAKEYLWALNLEDVKKQYVKSEIWKPKTYWHLNMSLIQGLSESFSSVNSGSTQRGGIQLEIQYESEMSKSTSWLWGLRYSRESQNFATSSVVNTRVLATGELRYHFTAVKKFFEARPFVALGFGVGTSRTTADGTLSSGISKLLPTTKFGLEIPMKRKDMFFMMDAAMESIRTEEEAFDNFQLSSNLTNFRSNIGIKYNW